MNEQIKPQFSGTESSKSGQNNRIKQNTRIILEQASHGCRKTYAERKNELKAKYGSDWKLSTEYKNWRGNL